ncbi:flagellar basal body P-ring formation chaperone FlgA [Roseibacterium sp. SDUM158017]|uniref:flagellar basal body P-ring formation chaperone FlgA n=1 Tax=Roseicyclus salinarum TaxID=3036773 RepID=UPI002415651A|nr:flagellar basal body P-ring formation chaperone FlgA [Roseibacterium sp. SDUM158017]MDG4648653.1 flagellar basal body P-ring formation chaperone FlgA [Roseibacterium sp. SDUM158017]
MRRLFPVIALLWASPLLADDFADLVEERARATLGAALAEEGVFRITYQPDVENAVLIARFWMDPATGQFLAEAILETGEAERVSGLALVTVPVPVPARRLMPDEIIAEGDLVTIDMPMGRLNDFSVTDTAGLVGRQVRRMLPEGRPVMAQSVMAPLVVTRGERVQIRYAEAGLELSAPGRALADAAEGDLVRVVNLVSNLSLVGTASAGGVVEVTR